jgi:hypothetical protein
MPVSRPRIAARLSYRPRQSWSGPVVSASPNVSAERAFCYQTPNVSETLRSTTSPNRAGDAEAGTLRWQPRNPLPREPKLSRGG